MVLCKVVRGIEVRDMSASNIVKLPSSEEIEQAKLSSRTLSKFHNEDRVTMSIQANNSEPETVVLPGIAMQMLLDILSDISKGKAISVIPYDAELSTQQAAHMLNVSRPYLVKLLEDKSIPHRKVGSHRRVYVKDVIEYKEKTDQARKKALEELSNISQSLNLGY